MSENREKAVAAYKGWLKDKGYDAAYLEHEDDDLVDAMTDLLDAKDKTYKTLIEELYYLGGREVRMMRALRNIRVWAQEARKKIGLRGEELPRERHVLGFLHRIEEATAEAEPKDKDASPDPLGLAARVLELEGRLREAPHDPTCPLFGRTSDTKLQYMAGHPPRANGPPIVCGCWKASLSSPSPPAVEAIRGVVRAVRGPNPDLTRYGWIPAALEVLEKYATSGLDEDPDATWEAHRELKLMYEGLRSALRDFPALAAGLEEEP